MKILIIGSEGFIGSNAVDFYLKKNYEVCGIDLKEIPHCEYQYHKVLPQTIQYDSIFEKFKPELCLFASGSASVSFSVNDPVSDLEANFLQVVRVLNMIRQHSADCKFINISSAAVYGNPEKLPVSESAAINPLSPYGWHKYYSELACREFSSLHGLKTASARPFSVYGPRQNKLLLWDIFQKTKTSCVELHGTGKESRDFIFIDDLIKGLDLIFTAGTMNGECYNIASGTETTIEEIAGRFLKTIGYTGQLLFNNVIRKGDPKNWRADVSLISSLGFKPTVSLESGLPLYKNWLRDNNLF